MIPFATMTAFAGEPITTVDITVTNIDVENVKATIIFPEDVEHSMLNIYGMKEGVAKYQGYLEEETTSGTTLNCYCYDRPSLEERRGKIERALNS